MQYSVRTRRRRLRPQTRDLAPDSTGGRVEGALAGGSGAVKRPLITQPVVERISPHAMSGCSER